jgi:septum formation protein
MPKIILASSSPRRKEVLESLGIDFEVCPSNYFEDHSKYTDPYKLVEEFALEKAREVAQNYPESIVIGADTIVVGPDGKLLGKAKDKKDAFRMLRSLQGREATIVSGLAFLVNGKEKVGHQEAKIFFKPITDEEIEKYLDDERADWYDKAGAFGVQGKTKQWIDRYEGEYETILGLPKSLFLEFYQE